TVTFATNGEPSNPQVVLTAGWTAPDGTRVYADFTGPLKTGKVTLRSEPARSQNEILALLLYGTADNATAANQLGGAAGGATAQPLSQALTGVNRALENIGVSNLTAKIDTSQATPRSDVSVQIAQDISLQVAVALGVPPPGQNQDTALITVAWQFLRRWSLETTVGTAGTSILDLVWQYRY